MTWSRQRLTTPQEFRSVTRGGVRTHRSHVVIHLGPLPQTGPESRVGFVVSKKIGNAVVRNRVTRRLREIIRPELEDLPAGSGVVLRALPGIDQQPFAQLRTDVHAGVAAALRKQERRGTPRTAEASRTTT